MIFRLGELYSGPGGLGLAAKMASIHNKKYLIQHAWATDYDQDSCNTYTENICPEDPKSVVCADIRRLDMNDLKKISDIDALAFGFPCNDFSIVGEQKGIEGKFGPLYSFGVKALKTFNPRWFLAENVGGLKNANDGDAFTKILEEFHKTGYAVYPHLYNFDEYGVPQSRQRIIIIGIRKDYNFEFKIPAPFKNGKVTCRSAIENPPIPENALNNELTRQSAIVVERLKNIRPGENVFTAKLPKKLQLNVKGAKISQIYRRLDPTKPSYTVTGSGGGGTHVYHWNEPRALTNRERARLQTFPDDYKFMGSKESVRKQIGMAVPPAGVKVIFESVLKTFAGIEYEFVKPNIAPIVFNKDYKIRTCSEQLRLLEKRAAYACRLK